MPFVKGQQRHPNSGRKKGTGEKRTTLTIKINEEVFRDFKNICLKKKFSQSKAVNGMILDFIEQYKEVLNEKSEEVFESPEEVSKKHEEVL